MGVPPGNPPAKAPAALDFLLFSLMLVHFPNVLSNSDIFWTLLALLLPMGHAIRHGASSSPRGSRAQGAYVMATTTISHDLKVGLPRGYTMSDDVHDL